MKPILRLLVGLGATAPLLALAACSDSGTQPASRVHATLSLRSGGGPSASLVTFDNIANVTLSDGEHFAGPIPASSVDSLIVVVSGVRVHLLGGEDDEDNDSLEGGDDSLEVPHDSVIAGPVIGASDGHEGDDDSLESEHEDEGNGWFSLAVTSGGRIDLMHLPTDSNGIVLASGEIPPGTYTRATLDIAEGWLWLNTPFVTPQGDTLPADQPIPIVVPSGRIHARVQFVVPEGGGDIPLVFDAGQTFHLVICGNGKVILTPVFRHED